MSDSFKVREPNCPEDRPPFDILKGLPETDRDIGDDMVELLAERCRNLLTESEGEVELYNSELAVSCANLAFLNYNRVSSFFQDDPVKFRIWIQNRVEDFNDHNLYYASLYNKFTDALSLTTNMAPFVLPIYVAAIIDTLGLPSHDLFYNQPQTDEKILKINSCTALGVDLLLDLYGELKKSPSK